MKNYVTIVSLVASLILGSCASVNTAHTPPDGSAERNAILQAVHHALARQGRKNLVLDVPYLKVHNGWAWIQVNPKSADGGQHYESQSGLLQQTANKWTLVEWMPDQASKIELLDPSGKEVDDPVGGSAEFYRVVAQQIHDSLTKRLKEIPCARRRPA